LNTMTTYLSIGCKIDATIKKIAKEPTITGNVWSVFAYDPSFEKLHIKKDDRLTIPTGITVTIPDGWLGLTYNVPGYANKYLDVIQTIIEPGKPTSVDVLVQSLKTGCFVCHGDLIAKFVIIPMGIQRTTVTRSLH
jgi:dUTPase